MTRIPANLRILAIALLAVGLSTPLLADSYQTPFCENVENQESPPICIQSYAVDSGSQENSSLEGELVFSTYVEVSRPVPWIMIRFTEETYLASGSFVRLSSLTDARQTVDIYARSLHKLPEIGYAMPYMFPGNSVLVQLYAGPNTTGNRIVIDHIILGGRNEAFEERIRNQAPDGLEGVSTKTICGTSDDRVGLSHPAVARLLNAQGGQGCTGFLVDCPDTDGSDRCLLSAGHCFGSVQISAIAQFNVPSSDMDCSINPPVDPNKVFLVDPNSYQNSVQEGAIGDDWAVFRLFRNAAGATAFEEQGSALSLGNQTPIPTSPLQVLGFGRDRGQADPCSPATCSQMNGQDNQVLQTDDGVVVSISPTAIRHDADTCVGNSGGPILLDSDGSVVGIHTDGGCTAQGGSNAGTFIGHPDVQDSIELCKQTHALILLDRTGSMLATRPSTGNTRCEDALQVARNDVISFFNEHPELEGSSVSIWTFAGSGVDILTQGFSTVFVGRDDALAALDALAPEGCGGLTPLAEALCEASDVLYDEFPLSNRLLAVSTDGVENNSDGECDGPDSATGPPYDPGSWQQKVSDKLIQQNVVLARLWGSIPASVDSETGAYIEGAGVSDLVFFQDLATRTGGTFLAVDDTSPLPPPFFGPLPPFFTIPTMTPLGLSLIIALLGAAGILFIRVRS